MNADTLKKKLDAGEELYFIVDKTFARGNQVYSGHSGKGENFRMFMSDYGKYAMSPQTEERCQEIIKEIEKDAKGQSTFDWILTPMWKIELCNFYEDIYQTNYDTLRESQEKLYKNQEAILTPM